MARARLPMAGACVLADCSFSMDERDGAMREGELPWSRTGPRRIDRLAKVLAYVLARTRLQALVAFADAPEQVALEGAVLLPEPSGGTALHLALDFAGGLSPVPERVIVITDGHPNSAEMALEAGRRLRPVVIDAYFVGPDEDAKALAFLEQLAGCGGPGGRSGRYDLEQTALTGEAMLLRLGGPKS